MTDRAQEIVARLNLKRHPEGGYFYEVFRSPHSVDPADDRSDRPSLTSIYFLLERGNSSKWHAVQSDEIWHYLEGDPLELLVVDPESMRLSRKVLGPLTDGQAPIQVVPANHWQAAACLGDLTLVGCSVGPGFVFEDFRLIRDDRDAASRLRATHSDLAHLL